MRVLKLLCTIKNFENVVFLLSLEKLEVQSDVVAFLHIDTP